MLAVVVVDAVVMDLVESLRFAVYGLRLVGDLSSEFRVQS